MTKKKILFVDDEPVVAALMKNRIESRGFQVEIASDGEGGIEKAKAWQPDLVLLDILMPGIDGYETCRRLKAMKETGHIPVVLFTALQEAQIEILARKAGAEKVVQKPFVDQVFKAISEILGPE
jgi:CheY-like chemotaxis protein